MTCGEFLYKLLLDCKLVNNYQCKLFWPYLFTNGKFDKLSKIKYSDPVRFVYKHC